MFVIRLATFLAVTLLSVLALAGLGQACCVYNNSAHPLWIKLDKLPDGTIHPTYHSCTRGTGGYATLSLMDPENKKGISNVDGLWVDDHGWISVYKLHDGRWEVKSKHKDGTVREKIYLKDLR